MEKAGRREGRTSNTCFDCFLLSLRRDQSKKRRHYPATNSQFNRINEKTSLSKSGINVMSCYVSGLQCTRGQTYHTQTSHELFSPLPAVTSLSTPTCLRSIYYHCSGLLGFISVKVHFVSITGQKTESVRTKPLEREA